MYFNMVLILNGSSEYDEHVRKELINFILFFSFLGVRNRE